MAEIVTLDFYAVCGKSRPGAGPAGQPSHLLTVGMLAPRQLILGGDDGATMLENAPSAAVQHIDQSDAVRSLLSELEKASPAEPASPENERARYIYILIAFSKFVRAVGGPREQVIHIFELAQHLRDLDHGIVGPVLKSAKFGKGRTGDSSRVWGARGRVATGLDALIRLGRTREEAAKSALRDFPGIRRLIRAESGKAKFEKDPIANILSWHDEFLRRQAGKGRSKNGYLADTLDIGVEALEQFAKSPELLLRFAQIQFDLASRI
jgi:hypothetical protein